ncbi:nucleoside transporter-domain-containing protein [Aspergillus flavus]|uniref:Nucleoside transporter-domain-containing protein n=2 Tax=Aspergillus subgen. Circumdati TaxID=2720871 RepID=A0A5N6GYB3_ASPFL|nr:nucleoside transporter [Aspergillus oryzae 3.042]KAB8247301.1 nucleoside transporter-domain-containing protein [Aspergillus flavus]|eukprot:EIT76226.1 nucleoside transporter [Aspergillus oryzae 3.042]
MDRFRRWISPRAEYEPLEHPPQDDEDHHLISSQTLSEPRFSRFEYGVFFLLGVSMLWAWNMFLAAAPYFYHRFSSDEWAAAHYQSSILIVSTVTNLGSSFTLAKLQKRTSYPKQITVSLLINIVIFTLLALSTGLLKNASIGLYFSFLMLMVAGTSLATGMNQIGVFAYVSGFGRPEYTQAIMAGQGLAGVLPCIVQILSVLVVPEQTGEQKVPQESAKSAFLYFITSTFVSLSALVAFGSLAKRRSNAMSEFAQSSPDTASDHTGRKTVSLWGLFKKLRFMALALFLCFAVTMMFPVFTAKIESVRDPQGSSRLFQPAVFIPLAFLFWNVGDLAGRMSVLIPQLSLTHRPFALFTFAIARIGFLPLYLLCNIRGREAVVKSDFFYLFVVQLLFGISNGYLGSSCMMGAGQWVPEGDRESAGGFMSLMLVGGLAAGSLLSFFLSGV